MANVIYRWNINVVEKTTNYQNRQWLCLITHGYLTVFMLCNYIFTQYVMTDSI
jgi:hypothetical protein